MKLKHLAGLLIVVLAFLSACNQNTPTTNGITAPSNTNLRQQTFYNPNTDWFRDAKYGNFIHWWWSSTMSTANFDVNGLANDLALGQPGYLIFTLGQNNGYYNSPNTKYNTYSGYAPGVRTSSRDLPNELYTALNAKGIKLMLYLPASPPNCDAQAAQGFGYTPYTSGADCGDGFVTLSTAQKWAEVIQEWSDRYGSKVAGWWFDGSWTTRFNNATEREQIFQLYANAAKHGNPNSILAFNPGVSVQQYTDKDDYTAGEMNDLFGATPSGRFLNGSQWQLLSFLGASWASGTGRYNAATVGNHIKNNIVPNGGVITLDVATDFAANGRLNQSMKDQMATIKSIVRDGVSSGTNLALGASSSASSNYDSVYSNSKANDSDVLTGWSPLVSDARPYWQLDLGAAYPLSTIQVVTRQDGDQPATRRNFEIRASNSPDMSNSVVLASQGATSLPYQATFTANITNANSYRYLRVAKTVNEYFYLSEVRVYQALVVDGGIYQFEPRNAVSRALDVNAASTADGANVQIWGYNGGSNQKWKAHNAGSGYWWFEPIHALGRSLDVNQAGTAAGSNVQIWGNNGGVNQQWRLVNNGSGYFQLNPRHAQDKCLDINGGGTTDGTNVQIWWCNGETSQQWKPIPR